MQRPATPPHALGRNPVSKRKALSSTAALLGLSGGALGWAGLAEAAEGERSLQTLLLPDHYQILDDGTVVFALKTGEQMSLSEEQYVLLDGGLVLVVDELAQNTIAELPVVGSLRTQLMTEVEPVRSPDGSIVEVSSTQPLWSGEGPTPKLFEEMDLQTYELAQDVATSDEDGLTIWGVARSAALASFGLGFGPSSLKFTSGDSVEFAENGTGTAYQAVATDDNGRLPEFSMGEGGDSALFRISADGALTFKSSPDYEIPADVGGDNSYDVQIKGTYRNGKEITKTVTVEVTNVAEGPAFTSGSSASFAENGTGTVYTAAAANEDGSAINTFSLVGGADQTLFSLTSAGVLTFNASPDYENPTDASSPADNDYEIEIQATGSNGQTTTQQVTVSVTNAREAVLYDINTDQSYASGNANLQNNKNIIELNGKVYFQATDETIGYELHVFDLNTRSVTGVDIYPGQTSSVNNGSQAYGFVESGGKVYFSGRDSAGGGLWEIDGGGNLSKVTVTAAGNQGAWNHWNTSYDGDIYQITSNEMTRIDPSTGVSQNVTDSTNFASLGITGAAAKGFPVVFDNGLTEDLYFWGHKNLAGYTSSIDGANDYNLYKYNSTTSTLTELAFQIDASMTSPSTDLFVFDNKIWIEIKDSLNNYNYYSWDGIYNGVQATLTQETNLSAPFLYSLDYPVEFGGSLYFRYYDGVGLSVYEIEANSAPQSESLATAFSASTNFDKAYTVNNQLYFRGDDANFGDELWSWDGVSASAARLTDINTGPANGLTFFVLGVASDESVFLSGDDGSTAEKELWVYG